jgi:hypothetical protein
MTSFRPNRRQALKALGYGAAAAASACGGSPLSRVPATRVPSPTPPPIPTSLPGPTFTAAPSITPTSTITPTASPTALNTPEPISPMQKSDLLKAYLRPARVAGLHVPYSFLERPIDYAALEAIMLGTGANCLVIDVKDEGGRVAVPFDHPLRPGGTHNAGFERVGKLVSWLLAHQYYPVARQVVMVDTPLASAHEELAYHFYSSQSYVDTSGAVWLNPERPEVADYNAAIAVAAAQMGFREIQLDYIRYPEADFDRPFERRVGAIASILTTLQSALNQQALLTIDVLDDSSSNYPDSAADGGYGQHIETLAGIVDGICPMLYPDLRHENIDVDYYQSVHDGTLRTAQKVAGGGSTAFVNPWIQAYFAAGLTRIRQQAEGAFQAGAVGVFAWNASLHYPDGMYDGAQS